MSQAVSVGKSFEDKAIALFLLTIIAPIMVLVALGVRLSSPGPVIYRQVRVGVGGRLFEILKFRSMQVDAEKISGPVVCRQNDPRRTAFGRFIRRWSLDELPQLINVLRGEMSIVGPRPERPEFVRQLASRLPQYRCRFEVNQGITGWAQIHDLRGDTDLAERLEYDLYYVQHSSVWLDILIILRTVAAIVHSKNSN